MLKVLFTVCIIYLWFTCRLLPVTYFTQSAVYNIYTFFVQVQVGDIVKVVNGQFFPADLILLSSR